MTTTSSHTRVAIVTGASRGIGAAVARRLAEDGFAVAINYASGSAEAEALAAELAAAGAKAVAIKADVANPEEVRAMFDAVEAQLGKVDVLVNNAGMSPVYPSVEAVSEELWDKVLDVNLKGPFRLTAIVGERMRRDGGGSIVNVSSIAARYPSADVVPYAAAKAGVNAITEAFAHTFGPTVRVNCIVPGTFLTDISKAWDMEAFERQAEGFALRRGGEPREIVGTLIYLASDASSYTTGALLPVDGGYRP
jgi:NAD(P)-dependent dehydrogenase (short-subunit alcohol dehydrogenase family)